MQPILMLCILYAVSFSQAEDHQKKDFTVSINVTYSPPSSFQGAPPFYQAGSTLSLTCVVDGVSEGVFYEWNSDCKAGSCFALGQSTQSVTKQYLESKDSGNYTCVVFDSLGCTGNASIELQVVGVGIYVTNGQQSLPNDGLIIAQAFSNRISEFRCLSGTRSPNVGQLIGNRGVDIVNDNSDPFYVRRGSLFNPGVIHVRNIRVFAANYEGIYTCQMPDEKGDTAVVNVGLYRSGVKAPVVTGIKVSVRGSDYILTCESTGSPATEVVWVLNGESISESDKSVKYSMKKTIKDRQESTYLSTLEISGGFEDIVGIYSCQVQNQLGSSNIVTKEIKSLYVSGYERPIIVGLEKTMNCSTHLNISKMEWILVGIQDDPVEQTTSSQFLPLTLSPKTVGLDGAMFTCRAVTAGGKVFEETVTIQVKELTNSVSINGTDNPLLAGGEYALDCVVESDVTPNVRWMSEKRTNISDSDDYQIEGPFVSGPNTILRLRFLTIKTTHGGLYYCESTINKLSSVQGASRTIIVKIPQPRVNVSRYPSDDLLYTTTQLTISCIIELVDVDTTTPFAINSTWNTPAEKASNVTDVLNNQRLDSTLLITSLQSSDSGTYTCSFIVSSSSEYIEASDQVSASTTIQAALKVAIRVSYTSPDQHSDYSPPNFRAASSVTLQCVAEGTTGSVRYQWSSTCRSCFASSSSSSRISEQFLRARDNGVHTCSVTDGAGNTGNQTQLMNITGAGIYVQTAQETGGVSSPQPNNTYIVRNNPSSESGTYFSLYCCSGALSSSSSATITDTGGSRIVPSSSNGYSISTYHSYDSYAGCVRIDASRACQRYSYRYGYISYHYTRIRECNSYYSAPAFGVYTCNIKNKQGLTQQVNYAIQTGATYPAVSSFSRVRYSSNLTLNCYTFRAPPTSIRWTRNGQPINIDGSAYRMSQRITSRSSIYFENKLEVLAAPDNFTGTYQCIVRNRRYSERTSSLIIRGIQVTSPAARLRVGQRATFDCTSDLDPTSINWYRNDIIVPTYSGQLSMNLVSTDNQDEVIKCRAESRYGPQERIITLATYVPSSWATVRISSNEQAALHNHSYTRTCTVTFINGITLPVTVEWLYSNSTLLTSEHIYVENSTENSTVKTLTLTFAPILTTDGGDYTCRASITVPWMDEQPPDVAVTVHVPVTTQAMFQLQMGPVQYCMSWNDDEISQLEDDIKESLETAIQERCDCDFESSEIYLGEFSCQTTTSRVTYRAIINGTSDILPAPQLLEHMEDWRVSGGTLLYGKFRLRLANQEDCPLEIESFHELECTAAASSAQSLETGDHCYKITSVSKEC